MGNTASLPLLSEIEFHVQHRSKVIIIEPANKIDARVIAAFGFDCDLDAFYIEAESHVTERHVFNRYERVGDAAPEITEFEVK